MINEFDLERLEDKIAGYKLWLFWQWLKIRIRGIKWNL